MIHGNAQSSSRFDARQGHERQENENMHHAIAAPRKTEKLLAVTQQTVGQQLTGLARQLRSHNPRFASSDTRHQTRNAQLTVSLHVALHADHADPERSYNLRLRAFARFDQLARNDTKTLNIVACVRENRQSPLKIVHMIVLALKPHQFVDRRCVFRKKGQLLVRHTSSFPLQAQPSF
ncbi:MAG: hypothetical protein NTY46_16560 [Candidatus Sumerlaeota bacterium]|nr:hypothetical protein [Candidatus Sumerlaeota bacterium]